MFDAVVVADQLVLQAFHCVGAKPLLASAPKRSIVALKSPSMFTTRSAARRVSTQSSDDGNKSNLPIYANTLNGFTFSTLEAYG